MPALPDAQLGHIGIYVRDIDNMIAFYTRTFGMVVNDDGVSSRPGSPRVAFLSRNAQEHHQLALATGRPNDGSSSTINQISFRVAGLEDLRTYYPVLASAQVAELDPRNHGNAWSIYFQDPEGNRVEIYTQTPWHVSQPFGRPLDLTKSAAQILAETEAMVKADPTHCPAAEFSARLATKLGR